MNSATRTPLLSIAIAEGRDVVLARQRSRLVAEALGLDPLDGVRIASAVSEVARNAFVHAGGGRLDISLEFDAGAPALVARIADDGPGITELDAVLHGEFRSANGGGQGLIGARRLMDAFDIESTRKGTVVKLTKLLPPGRAYGAHDVARLNDLLARQRVADPLEELQRQNQDLITTMAELRRRQAELVQLNRELEDTNRGVVALYAELDEHADHLRQGDELKRRFLSHMSHEFRTPLHSILGLTRMLESRVDGSLSAEQEKQVAYIQRGAKELLELVDDLLDLAKVEAGRIEVRAVEFSVEDLFGALRGMLKPLLVNERLQLVFQNDAGALVLDTDEGKVSQILRNLVSNALKFTQAGEVRVTALAPSADGRITFRVSDTGIGISSADAERIFDEFTQIDGPVQRGVKGTGLGLPLSRKLAHLLGGDIRVESTQQVGSTFTLELPLSFTGASFTGASFAGTREHELAPLAATAPGVPVLVVEDDEQDRRLIERHLQGTRFRPIFAATLREARPILENSPPALVVLDVMLDGEESWPLLAEIRAEARWAALPVIVVSAGDAETQALDRGAAAFQRKPLRLAWLLPKLDELCGDALLVSTTRESLPAGLDASPAKS